MCKPWPTTYIYLNNDVALDDKAWNDLAFLT